MGFWSFKLTRYDKGKKKNWYTNQRFGAGTKKWTTPSSVENKTINWICINYLLTSACSMSQHRYQNNSSRNNTRTTRTQNMKQIMHLTVLLSLFYHVPYEVNCWQFRKWCEHGFHFLRDLSEFCSLLSFKRITGGQDHFLLVKKCQGNCYAEIKNQRWLICVSRIRKYGITAFP
jgi:hypothetical protein